MRTSVKIIAIAAVSALAASPAIAKQGGHGGAHHAANHHAQNHTPHHRDRDNNPPGRAGGPGTNWENPRGPAGGPGASPDRRVPPRQRDPGVNARQHHQRDRIAEGARSGELTRDEMKELSTDRREIRQEERQYKSDGTLTKTERQDLHQDLNEASRNIYEEKHDAEQR